jgi:hypothetical protein
MKGLMNAVGAMSVRNSTRDAGEGVTGEFSFVDFVVPKLIAQGCRIDFD